MVYKLNSKGSKQRSTITGTTGEGKALPVTGREVVRSRGSHIF
jgi:hypothetical protein